ncbi:hypothetical protein E2C01_053127 [Portunus trituberculatus]|uniref:Uncharacterized protein n=2 Tax=Portunus trituberculatus TaxID=210409 RepID=A0A5B7GJH7_PORTR|nr:hypothetical protein [Portunus trituberculatus]
MSRRPLYRRSPDRDLTCYDPASCPSRRSSQRVGGTGKGPGDGGWVSHSLASLYYRPWVLLARPKATCPEMGGASFSDPYKATGTLARYALSPPSPTVVMLRAFSFLCLVGLALAGHYGTPQVTCEPKHETLTVTRTSLITIPQQVTQLDLQYEHQTVDITSVVLVPKTVINTQTVTFFPNPDVITHTTLFTATHYQTNFVTHLATAVATQTSQVVATAQEVEEQVITQTAVVDQIVTNTLTITNQKTTFKTLTVTNTVNTHITHTETETFAVTETSYQTFVQHATDTVTSLTEHTNHVTVTTTEHELVTKCPEPKITYNH